MSASIKQGDCLRLMVSLRLNGAALDMYWVEKVEFMIGKLRKLWPGEAEYDTSNQIFYIPLTQEESLALAPDGSVEVDVRVKFSGGSVKGARKKQYLNAADALSKEVL